jgi:hypothetical protein
MLARMGGWDLSEYKDLKNIITYIAAINDMLKCAGVYNAQRTSYC